MDTCHKKRLSVSCTYSCICNLQYELMKMYKHVVQMSYLQYVTCNWMLHATKNQLQMIVAKNRFSSNVKLFKVMLISNYTNQKGKTINVMWNQNGARINHMLTYIHKIHHTPNSRRVITLFTIVYFIVPHSSQTK